jgi:hypothetical protein
MSTDELHSGDPGRELDRDDQAVRISAILKHARSAFSGLAVGTAAVMSIIIRQFAWLVVRFPRWEIEMLAASPEAGRRSRQRPGDRNRFFLT